jgi:hypothetical protein
MPSISAIRDVVLAPESATLTSPQLSRFRRFYGPLAKTKGEEVTHNNFPK